MTIRDLVSQISADENNSIKDDVDFDTLTTLIEAEFEKIRNYYTAGLLTVEEALSKASLSLLDLQLFVDMIARGAKDADAATKSNCYRLLAALHIPLTCLERCPSDIPAPRLECTHWYAQSASMLVIDTPVCDGGLALHSTPVGKTFNLLFANGAEANIRITEAIKDGEQSVAYLGMGTITGYASTKIEREISIRSHKGQLGAFSFSMFHILQGQDGATYSDWDVYHSHPLWEQFREWRTEHAWFETYQAALLDHLGIEAQAQAQGRTQAPTTL